MLKYPSLFTSQQPSGYVVTFRDIPEALTQGETVQECIDMGKDALQLSFDFYLEDDRYFPLPSPKQIDETMIEVDNKIANKIARHNLTFSNVPLHERAFWQGFIIPDSEGSSQILTVEGKLKRS